MKVFLGWPGDNSKSVPEALADRFPLLFVGIVLTISKGKCVFYQLPLSRLFLLKQPLF